MDEIYLTVKEVAELKACTERYIRALIAKNKLSAIEIDGQAVGQGGICYRVPLSALDSKLQIKYKRQQRKLEKVKAADEVQPEVCVIDFESITDSEREEIAKWNKIIKEWLAFRNSAVSKAEGDAHFIKFMEEAQPELKLTQRTLYRKWAAFKNGGEGALIDRRGKHNSHARKLTDEMFDIFEFYFLDESQKSVSLCVFLTEAELKRRYGEVPLMPSCDTFERAVKKIPVPYVLYFREGKKSFIEKCAPYIKRMYDDLEPNDIWVADNHTFDVMVNNEGTAVRLYLTAFMDVRTRKMMGWCVTDAPSSDSTIYALKKGVEKYGAPKMIYTDNGREFLFHDFGGHGFRKRAKLKPGELVLPTILSDLGIEFTTALPTNARAKGVERAFKTVKENFSKLFADYTGGNVLEKPERLKGVVKRLDLLPTVKEFTEFVDTYLSGFYNKQPHSGDGMWDKSPDSVFAENLYEMRVVPKDKINLMFMRYSYGTVKVGKNGVSLKLYGQELQYFTEDLWREFFSQDVYVRYSPDDLSSVRVYNTKNRFICEAPLKTKLSYKATKEAVKQESRKNNAAVKTVKNYKKLKDIEAQNELDAVLDNAAGNIELPENINPKLLKPIYFDEQPLPAAVGFDNELTINWTEALEKQKIIKFKQYLNTF